MDKGCQGLVKDLVVIVLFCFVGVILFRMVCVGRKSKRSATGKKMRRFYTIDDRAMLWIFAMLEAQNSMRYTLDLIVPSRHI